MHTGMNPWLVALVTLQIVSVSGAPVDSPSSSSGSNFGNLPPGTPRGQVFQIDTDASSWIETPLDAHRPTQRPRLGSLADDTANNRKIRRRPPLIIPPGSNEPPPDTVPEGNNRNRLPAPLFGPSGQGAQDGEPRHLSAIREFLQTQEAARNLPPPPPPPEQPSRRRTLFGPPDAAGIEAFLQTKETEHILRGFVPWDRPSTSRPNSNVGSGQRPILPIDPLSTVPPNTLSLSATGPRGFAGTAGAGPSAPPRPPSPPQQAHQAATEGQVARQALEERIARMVAELFASAAKNLHR